MFQGLLLKTGNNSMPTLKLLKDRLPPGAALSAVQVPGSKSVTNRALLLAALAPGTSTLHGGLEAEDTRWMRECLWTLGMPVVEVNDSWSISGGFAPTAAAPIYVGASGTTLRFLLPWLALSAKVPVRINGAARLFERPLEPLLAPLLALGAKWKFEGNGAWLHPVPEIPEQLDVMIDGSLSSQFITGLVLAAAGLRKGGMLSWDKPVASPSYLEITRHWLARFGCESELRSSSWRIPGNQLNAVDVDLPGDWSGAAAFLAAAAVTGRSISVGPLDPGDAQGDRALEGILVNAGCTSHWHGHRLSLSGPLLRGIHADLTLCPDLGPVLAATCALAPEPSTLTGLSTLTHKECDRLDASAELVRWLGGEADIIGDHTLEIRPAIAFRLQGPPAPFDPRNDHRMAFAAAVGALRCGGELKDPACVAKTFPEFWGVWKAMLRRNP